MEAAEGVTDTAVVDPVNAAAVSALEAYAGGTNMMHLLLGQSTRNALTNEILSPGRQFVAIILHLLFLMVVAFIYGKYFTYPYPEIVGRQKPHSLGGIFYQGFDYGLFEAFTLKPDFRICFFGCFFMPVRWADTASSVKIAFTPFWPGLCLFSLLYGFAALSHFITAAMFLLLVVTCRQKIRAVYGMAYGTKETVCADCITWLCCGPCATMQEAMHVELAVSPDYEQAMSSRNAMMSSVGGAVATGGAAVKAAERLGEREINELRPGTFVEGQEPEAPFATRKQKSTCC